MAGPTRCTSPEQPQQECRYIERGALGDPWEDVIGVVLTSLELLLTSGTWCPLSPCPASWHGDLQGVGGRGDGEFEARL